jgi:hypothetical protein
MHMFSSQLLTIHPACAQHRSTSPHRYHHFDTDDRRCCAVSSYHRLRASRPGVRARNSCCRSDTNRKHTSSGLNPSSSGHSQA